MKEKFKVYEVPNGKIHIKMKDNYFCGTWWDPGDIALGSYNISTILFYKDKMCKRCLKQIEKSIEKYKLKEFLPKEFFEI